MENYPLTMMRMAESFVLSEDTLISSDEDDEEIDIYAALGLDTPIEAPASNNNHQSEFTIDPMDPLAAFMDDDEEDEETSTFGAISSPKVPVEELLAILVKDTLGDAQIHQTLPTDNVSIDLNSTRVQKDRDAYHLSLIIDMGGEHIKPFATVRASGDTWAPMQPPKGLHQGWIPLYHSLAKALTNALMQQGRPSSL